jgi:hypothetical protein
MKHKLAALCLFMTVFYNCSSEKYEKYEKNDNNDLFVALLIGKETGSTEALATQLELNGSWDSYYSSTVASNSITTIGAVSGKNGSWIDDTSGFSSYYLITAYSNQGTGSSGYIIKQNPQNNGAYSGDTTKGKYSKVTFYKSSTTKFYYCENVFGKSSQAEAIAASGPNIPSNPEASNTCGTSNWSWLIRRN